MASFYNLLSLIFDVKSLIISNQNLAPFTIFESFSNFRFPLFFFLLHWFLKLLLG